MLLSRPSDKWTDGLVIFEAPLSARGLKIQESASVQEQDSLHARREISQPPCAVASSLVILRPALLFRTLAVRSRDTRGRNYLYEVTSAPTPQT